jgi:NADH-quinone oxidoreductase subunit K
MIRYDIDTLYKNFLVFSQIMFIIGFFGILLHKRNMLIILMSFEICLLGINFSFIFTSLYLGDMLGQLFVLFILTIAAIEAAIGISFLVYYYKKARTIAIENFRQMRG